MTEIEQGPEESVDLAVVAGPGTVGTVGGDIAPESGLAGESPASAAAGGDCTETAAVPEATRPALAGLLEAILFAAAEPLAASRLARALAGVTRADVTAALEELRAGLESSGRGIRLVEVAGGWQLRSAVEMASWVARFFDEKPPRLSRAFLETVAIVAYRQPCTRGEVEAVRGVNCDAVLSSLLQRGLLEITGRRSSPGRPVEYATTRGFLELFGLRDLGELPPLPDPKALADLVTDAPTDDEELEAAGTDPAWAEMDGDGGVGASTENSEPSGDGLETSGGGSDPGGSGPSERQDGDGSGDPSRSAARLGDG